MYCWLSLPLSLSLCVCAGSIAAYFFVVLMGNTQFFFLPFRSALFSCSRLCLIICIYARWLLGPAVYNEMCNICRNCVHNIQCSLSQACRRSPFLRTAQILALLFDKMVKFDIVKNKVETKLTTIQRTPTVPHLLRCVAFFHHKYTRPALCRTNKLIGMVISLMVSIVAFAWLRIKWPLIKLT